MKKGLALSGDMVNWGIVHICTATRTHQLYKLRIRSEWESRHRQTKFTHILTQRNRFWGKRKDAVNREIGQSQEGQSEYNCLLQECIMSNDHMSWSQCWEALPLLFLPHLHWSKYRDKLCDIKIVENRENSSGHDTATIRLVSKSGRPLTSGGRVVATKWSLAGYELVKRRLMTTFEPSFSST